MKNQESVIKNKTFSCPNLLNCHCWFCFRQLCIGIFSSKLKPKRLWQAVKMSLHFFPSFFLYRKCFTFINVFDILNKKKKNMPKRFQNGHCKFTTHVPVMQFKRGAFAEKVFMCFSIIGYYFNFCVWFCKLLFSSTAWFRKYLHPEQQFVNTCLVQTWF